MAADLVTIATTAVLTQFLGPSAKHFGELVLEQGKQVSRKAVALLAAVGREPQAVEPKVLLPLVQAAALETDESLANKWAALLANAADPVQQVKVQPGFVEVLRQLTPIDAEVLFVIFHIQLGNASNTMATEVLAALKGVERDVFVASIGNLERLGLVRGIATQRVHGGATTNYFLVASLFFGSDTDSVALMPFGRGFLAAVTPPTA